MTKENDNWKFNERIIKLLPTPMVVIDSKKKVLIINQGFKNIFSVYKKVLRRNQHLKTIFENNIDLYERIDEILNSENGSTKFVYILEEQFYLVSIHAIREASHQASYIIMFDNITKQEEIELIRRKFISNVAHELRTPLAAMSSHAEIIAYQDNVEKSEMIDNAKIIYSEVQRLSKMVNELLDITKYDQMQIKLNKEEFNVSDLINEVANMYEKKDANEHVDLIFDCQDIDMFADYDKLKQVCINLLENAYNHTKNRVELIVQEKNGKVRLAVIDNGVGLTLEQKSKVFERFYRTDESRNRVSGGTGLGLSIVKEIVELHNGKIFVQGEKNKGAEFIVEIPIKS